MKTILKQFNEVVKQYGENIALKEKNKLMTYNELETETNKIANYLIQNGLLNRTPKGRMATDLAYRHLGIEK